MKNTGKPTYKDLYDIAKGFCTAPNPWAFCIQWHTSRPKLFNRFMDMCARFRKDESFLEYKTRDTEFMYHSKLKQDVLVSHNSPTGFVVYWEPTTRQWVKDRAKHFSQPKDKHD